MRFPILYGRRERSLYAESGLSDSVPWGVLAPHEEQARNNHQQSLKRLAERGGLCPREMAAVIRDESWRDAKSRSAEDAAIVILDAIDAMDSAT